MYSDIQDAMSVLSGLAEDALIAAMLSLAVPVVTLDWTDHPDTRPLTFVGGAPFWSAVQEWPTPPVPDNVEDIAGRGGDMHGPHIKQSLTARLPYSFVGQIDLQTAAVPGLPKTGRLHFFYDIATGPWDTGQRSARVIWDQTPVTDLVEAEIPAPLLAAEAQEQKMALQPVELDEAMLTILRQSGLSEAEITDIQAETARPPEDPGNYFIGPKRALAPRSAIQLPVWSNLEWDEFVEGVSDASGQITTSEALADIMDASEIKLEERSTPHRRKFPDRTFQVGGLPYPEQDDPRLSAAIVLVLGKQYLEDGDWDRHKPDLYAAARGMRLLFQVSVADWLDSDGEGTVYFLISEQDLSAREFQNVFAVYQQT